MLQTEKACFSNVNDGELGHRPDFSVAFSDIQELQQLQQKVLRTSAVITSCQEVASHIDNHCRRLDSLKIKPPSDNVLEVIEDYLADLVLHQRSLQTLVQTLRGTENLVSVNVPSTRAHW